MATSSDAARRARALALTLVGAGLLAYVLARRGPDLGALAGAGPGALLAIAALGAAGRAFSGAALRRVLGAMGHEVGLGEAYAVMIATGYGNLFLPFAGWTSPALYLGGVRGIPLAEVAAAGALLGVLQLLALGLLGAGAFLAGGHATGGAVLLLGFGACVLAPVVVLARLARLGDAPARWPGPLARLAPLARAGAAAAREPRVLAGALALLAGGIATRVARVGACFAATGAVVAAGDVAVLSCAGDLAVLAGLTPGGLGLRELVVDLAAGPVAVPAATAAAAVLLDRVVLSLTVAILAQPAIAWMARRAREAGATEAPSPPGSARRRDLLLATLLVALGLGVRLLHARASEVRHPGQGDQAKYLAVADNLARHGVYSLDTTAPPRTPTDLAPGYPAFLAVARGAAGNDDRARLAQALLGACSVGLLYALALPGLGRAGAAAAALLLAASPHHVALADLFLTETLFAALLLAGVLGTLLAWRRDSGPLAGLAGAALAGAAAVRVVAAPLVLLLPACFLLPPRGGRWDRRRATRVLVPVALLGALAVGGGVVAFRGLTRPVEPAAHGHRYVSGGTLWRHVLRGSYPGGFAPPGTRARFEYQRDPRYRELEADPSRGARALADRVASEPGRYLGWYLFGKLPVGLRWDHAYHEGVYVYPMARRGFRQAPLLRTLHAGARALHLPLQLAGLLGVLLVLARLLAGGAAPRDRALLPALVALAYGAAILVALMPLPRYSIPYRPLLWIFAFVPLRELARLVPGKRGP